MKQRKVLNSVIDNLAITERGVLESVSDDVCTIIIDRQVYPEMDFIAKLDLKNNIGEEVIICFLGNNRSDGIVVGVVAEYDSIIENATIEDIAGLPEALDDLQTALDGMVNYIQDEVDRLTVDLTAKITEEVTAKVTADLTTKMKSQTL